MTALRKRGFAAMSREQQRDIASKGGRAAHHKGTAHEFSSEEARKAGYLGGKAVSANREHMATIGRKGGQRASRALNTQRSGQSSNRHEPISEGPTPPEFTDYRQQGGSSPSVILPHWREIPPSPGQQEETEEDKPQPHNGQTSEHSPLTTLPEATNVSWTPPSSPPKKTNEENL